MKNYQKLLAISAVSIILPFSSKANDLDLGIKRSQKQWEEAKYQFKNKDQKITKLEECASDAKKLGEEFSQNAEPLIWEGICTATQADILKLSALSKAKTAKALFEKALTINPNALDGSAYTNLGVLYHRVPGWPIGFGDSKLAAENFKKALAIAPDNIDANYFYALFLEDQKNYPEALNYLEKALNAPSRNRPLADSKRKEEAQEKISKIKEELK